MSTPDRFAAAARDVLTDVRADILSEEAAIEAVLLAVQELRRRIRDLNAEIRSRRSSVAELRSTEAYLAGKLSPDGGGAVPPTLAIEGQLDAAGVILGEARGPMRLVDVIRAMQERGYRPGECRTVLYNSLYSSMRKSGRFERTRDGRWRLSREIAP